MQNGIETRYVIHEILKLIKIKSFSFDKIFSKKLENRNFKQSDKKFIQNVVMNSMRHHLFVNSIIKKFTKNINQKSDSYFLLLSSITQLIILNFKEFAVVNSTVELSKNKNIKTSTNFINGVLRNLIRKKNTLKNIEINFHQLPNWFKKQNFNWKIQNKKEFLKQILKEPKIHLVFKKRKNINRIFEGTRTSELSIMLNRNIKTEEIPDYHNGTWWMQDFAAMLPLYLMDSVKNKKTADLCAAPGGKTFQLISMGAKVTAFEKNKARSEIMRENLKRLNLNCKIHIIDLLKERINEKFDLVILDVPCSSVGTLRRNPEIFFRNQKPNLNLIKIKQKQFLNSAKRILNTKGVLIYMVCSFFKEETEDQIFNFLKNNKNFILSTFEKKKLSIAEKFIDKNGFFSTSPNTLNKNIPYDGFFAAKLIKND